MLYRLYKFSTIALAPCLPAYLQKRVQKGKEEAARLTERYGIPSLDRPAGTLVWIHAASVGEARSVLTLVHRLLERHPDWSILVTTGTVTSAKILSHELPQRAFHQYIPLDVPSWTDTFLHHWKPNLIVWVEQELWPNMLAAIHKKKIPLILANGRLEESSYRRWRYFKPVVRKMLHSFHTIYAQSTYDARRYEALSDRKVIAKGNLKFATPPLSFDASKLGALQKDIQERPVWLAASTHPGEEALILQAHQLILKQRPNALLIIAPRHADRGPSLVQLIKEAHLVSAQRQSGEEITQKTQVYLADTMGELGTFYRLAPISFIGGSLVPIGGHNLIEPAQLGCVTVHGPYIGNIQEIAEEFSARNIGYQINSIQELADTVLNLLNSPALVKSIGQKAREFVGEQGQVLDILLMDIEEIIPPL